MTSTRDSPSGSFESAGSPRGLSIGEARSDQSPDSDFASDAGLALISAALSGDAAALARVWEQERRWVAAVLLAHKPREADLEDLLQDVALTLVSKISDVRDPEGFRPWLRAVAISLARTRGRRQQVRRQGFLKLVSWARGEANAVAARSPSEYAAAGFDNGLSASRDRASAHAIEHGRHLLDLSADLPDGYREPLLLKCVQGMSYRQIGRVMGLPETTIETRIARARRMLRERADQGAEHESELKPDEARKPGSSREPHDAREPVMATSSRGTAHEARKP